MLRVVPGQKTTATVATKCRQTETLERQLTQVGRLVFPTPHGRDLPISSEWVKPRPCVLSQGDHERGTDDAKAKHQGSSDPTRHSRIG